MQDRKLAGPERPVSEVRHERALHLLPERPRYPPLGVVVVGGTGVAVRPGPLGRAPPGDGVGGWLPPVIGGRSTPQVRMVRIAERRGSRRRPSRAARRRAHGRVEVEGGEVVAELAMLRYMVAPVALWLAGDTAGVGGWRPARPPAGLPLHAALRKSRQANHGPKPFRKTRWGGIAQAMT